MNQTKSPQIIGVAGGTGSGKTTFCNRMSDRLDSNVAVIPHDMYYKDLSHISPSVRNKQNFDHPDALDNNLLIEHLKALRQGRAIDIPIYVFKTHIRNGRMKRLDPTDIILVEGITLFTDSRIRNLLDYKVYIEFDADVRFIRRMRRDIKERGRSLDSVIEQYLSSVKPMHDKYVEPYKKYADIVVSGYNIDEAVESTLAFIKHSYI